MGPIADMFSPFLVPRVLGYLVEGYFAFYTYVVFLSTLGALVFRLRYKPCCEAPEPLTRFALMIPAYKPNRQLLHAVKACFSQSYPRSHYEVFVLAQQASPELVKAVRACGAVVFEKRFEDCAGNPYLHALNFFVRAVEKYAQGRTPYEAMVLIDKDNLIEEDFLQVVNCRFRQGQVAVQGRRRPFNLETPASCFDYISEAMNDQMLRAAKATFGLSAEVSGSAMAFEFGLYKKAIGRVDFQSPVHDKAFFMELLKLKVRVFYEPEAIAYEEKTDAYEAISYQRTRWIGGQFYLWRRNFLKLLATGLRELRLDPVDYAFTLFRLPRSLHVSGLILLTLLAHFSQGMSIFPSWHWPFCLVAYFACILMLLLLDGAPPRVFLAFFSAPFFLYSIVKSTWRAITSNLSGTFIHTKHSKEVSLQEVKGRKS